MGWQGKVGPMIRGISSQLTINSKYQTPNSKQTQNTKTCVIAGLKEVSIAMAICEA
jgi:hypothetical protein